MSTTELGKAMSSRSRLQMLDLVSRRTMSIEELSREVSLKTIIVRHHVNMLKSMGLVEEQAEERPKIGRRVLRYQSTQKTMSIQYPKRQYELLSRNSRARLKEDTLSNAQLCLLGACEGIPGP